MTLTVDCGTVENARAVNAMMPRVYNAVIMELNREPLGTNGRVTDRDLEPLKRRLLLRINRALQRVPQAFGVYIRRLTDVPSLTGSPSPCPLAPHAQAGPASMSPHNRPPAAHQRPPTLRDGL